MPVNSVSYQNGKIYKIWSLMTEKIYIGSSADTLSNRFCRHKTHYKRWKEGEFHKCGSFDLFELVGVENCRIDLVKMFPCNSKAELNREEGDVMRQYKDILINKYIAGRTKNEYKIDHKQQIAEQQKQYQQINKEVIAEKAKEYYESNKQAILEKQKIKYTCVCGSISTICKKSQHERTKKHQTFITTQ